MSYLLGHMEAARIVAAAMKEQAVKQPNWLKQSEVSAFVLAGIADALDAAADEMEFRMRQQAGSGEIADA